MVPESVCRMGRKVMFIELVRKGMTVTEASLTAGMVRQVAQKWLKRVREFGLEAGLKEQSRARKTQRRFEGPAIDVGDHEDPRESGAATAGDRDRRPARVATSWCAWPLSPRPHDV